MNNRRYVIISTDHIQYIDFTVVMQTNPNSMRRSVDGTKTIVKYEGEQPDFVFNMTQDAIGLEEYNHKEILEIIRGPEWSSQD